MFVSRLPAPRASAIEKTLYALARAELQHNGLDRSAVIEKACADKAIASVLQRTAAPIATTTDSGFASQLAQNLIGDFVSTLAPLSAAAQIASRGLMVPMGRSASMKIPAREGAPAAVPSWVQEAAPIPVRQFELNDNCELSPRKFGFIIGISAEVAKRSNGEQVIRQLIREDAAASLDGSFFNDVAGDGEKHAGMLAGVSAINGFAGGDRLAAETDLVTLSNAISAGGSGDLVFIVSPKRANNIKIRWPEWNRELTFLPSLAVADDTIVACDPASWIFGFGDDFQIDASKQATVHMDTAPAEIVSSTGPTTAAPVRSFWQTDSLALKLICDVAFSARRASAAAWAQNLTW